MTQRIIVPSAGIKPMPAHGSSNVGTAKQGDTLSVDPAWTYATMTSGAARGVRGWLPSASVGTLYPSPALGLYTLNTAANGWRDSWASTQKALTGTVPGVVHVFQPWSLVAPEGGWWGKFDPAWASDAIQAGSVPIVSLEGRNLSLPNEAPQPAYNNAAVLAGQWDAALTAWATDAAAWLAQDPKHRLIVRLDHEGNGKWFPWAAGTNGNSPESAIAVYRYKVRLMRAIAARLEFVWTPGTSGSGWLPLEDCYPGSNYVDWLGGDWYNTSDLPGGWSGHWSEFAEFKPAYDRLCALDPTLRIIIGETGTVTQAGRDTAAWWANVLPACAAMPRIAAVVAFDQTYGALDFRVRNAGSAWAAALRASGRLI